MASINDSQYPFSAYRAEPLDGPAIADQQPDIAATISLDDKEIHDPAGHRARLRDRLLTGGRDAMGEHELVEYLLALAIPRRDTKPLAWKLLREFGGFGRLVHASPDELARIPGMGPTAVAAIKIAEATALNLLKRAVDGQPILASWAAVIDYLHADMADRDVEQVRVLHLNSRNMLIRDEQISEGSIDQSAIYVREVIKRALELGSAAIILAHNHPSGDPAPSRQDIAITRDIIDSGARLGITVHDHIIIGRSGHASMKAMGLI